MLLTKKERKEERKKERKKEIVRKQYAVPPTGGGVMSQFGEFRQNVTAKRRGWDGQHDASATTGHFRMRLTSATSEPRRFIKTQ